MNKNLEENLLEGVTLKGNNGHDYKIGKRIGRGGNSVVYNVTGQNLNCRCVVKVLNADYNDKPWVIENRKQRFKHEIAAVKYILDNDHECNILPIYDYSYENNEIFWCIMPFADRLDGYLRKTRNNVIDKITLAIRLAEIIQHLQSLDKPQAHRDIKLQNLYVYNGKVHLADFGLVWSEDTNAITGTEEQLGAYSTRAPWMHRAGMHRGQKSELAADVYSFVKTAWWILTQQRYSFQGTYNVQNLAFRDVEEVCGELYKNSTKTIAPLHKLFEFSNISTPNDMPKIQECIEILHEFVEANKNPSMARKINRNWIVREIFGTCSAEKIAFKTGQGIVQILNKINKQYTMNIAYNTITMLQIYSVPDTAKDKEKENLGDDKIVILGNANTEFTLIPSHLQIDRSGNEPQIRLYARSYEKEGEGFISVRELLQTPGVPLEPKSKIVIDMDMEIKLQPIL